MTKRPATSRNGLLPALVRNAFFIASLAIHGMLAALVLLAISDPAGLGAGHGPVRVFFEERPARRADVFEDLDRLPPLDEIPPPSVAPEDESIARIAPEDIAPPFDTITPPLDAIPDVPPRETAVDGPPADGAPGDEEPDPLLALLPGGGAALVGGRVDPYGGRRSPEAREALSEARGGSEKTRQAVAMALRWLADHQDADGRWNPAGFAKHDPPDDPTPNPRFATEYGSRYEVGITGLATLAFLGDGHTPREGDYRDTVRRAVEWLVSRQRPDGGIGQALALAEAAALTGDEALIRPLRLAVEFIARAQSPTGGWDYFDAGNVTRGRDDSSIAGWQIMALVSARNAGVEPPHDVWLKALSHIDSLTTPDGYLRYANRDFLADRQGVALAAVGMMIRLMLGFDPQSDIIQKGAAILDADLPDWNRLAHASIRERPYELHSMYYWYHGTLALAQIEGPVWRRWNEAMISTLVGRQVAEGSGRGTWDPDGIWAMQQGGRIYSTALNALNLEVYYRILPLYRIGGSDVLIAPIEAQWAAQANPRRRSELIALLGQLVTPRAASLLQRIATEDTVPSIRMEAYRQLARGRRPQMFDATPALWEQSDAATRGEILALLAGFDDRRVLPLAIAAIADPDEAVAKAAAALFTDLTGRTVEAKLPLPPDEAEALTASLTEWVATAAQPLVSQRTREVRGEVMALLPAQGVVMTNLGAAAGMKPGMTLRLTRNGHTIGRCEIVEVFPQASIARLEPIGSHPPQRGDKVIARVAENE